MPIHNGKLAVEDILPEDFFHSLGVYLQTCAHVEMSACALIACLEGLDPENADWELRYFKLRKMGTTPMIQSLRVSVEQAEEYGFSKQLEELSEWLHNFKSNRHQAVHGAFIATGRYYKVDYVQQVGKGEKAQYKRTRTPVIEPGIDQVCTDANRIFFAAC